MSQGLVALSYLQTLNEAVRVSSSALTPGVTALTTGINSSVTTLSVDDFTGFPGSGNYYIMVESEQMQVTGGQGTGTWTVTRGTNGTTAASHSGGVAIYQSATTLIPIEPVFFEPMVARYNPALMRNSFEKFYESVIVSQHSEIRGIKAPATYETLTNWLSWAVKGGVTPTLSNTAAYTWDFTPSLSTDDLAGMGAEMGNDTADYHISALYCQQFAIDFTRGNEAASISTDFVGQQAFAMGAKTPGLSATNLDIINPAYVQTYIDSATIGTTAFNDIKSAQVSVNNGIQQLYFLNGTLYPTAIARPTRNLDISITQWFDSATELANAMNAVGNGVERKIRLAATGPNITGSSPATNMSMTVDAYAYWDAFPFRAEQDVWHVEFKGRSVYDTTAGSSWSIELVNGLATIP